MSSWCLLVKQDPRATLNSVSLVNITKNATRTLNSFLSILQTWSLLPSKLNYTKMRMLEKTTLNKTPVNGRCPSTLKVVWQFPRKIKFKKLKKRISKRRKLKSLSRPKWLSNSSKWTKINSPLNSPTLVAASNSSTSNIMLFSTRSMNLTILCELLNLYADGYLWIIVYSSSQPI